MINETIKRLINPNGAGYRIMRALASLPESPSGRPSAVHIHEVAAMTGLPEDIVPGLVAEMATAEIVRTADGYVWLWWLGHFWVEELAAQHLLEVARLLGVPTVGIASGVGSQARISLTFGVSSMWDLIDALERAIAASEPQDKERLAAIKTALGCHQDRLLLTTEGEGEPGPYTILDDDVPARFELELARSLPSGDC